jgi:hypothetical protein
MNALTKKRKKKAPSLAQNSLEVHWLKFNFVVHILPSGQLPLIRNINTVQGYILCWSLPGG